LLNEDKSGKLLSPDTIGSQILDKSEDEKLCGEDKTVGNFFK